MRPLEPLQAVTATPRAAGGIVADYINQARPARAQPPILCSAERNQYTAPPRTAASGPRAGAAAAPAWCRGMSRETGEGGGGVGAGIKVQGARRWRVSADSNGRDGRAGRACRADSKR